MMKLLLAGLALLIAVIVVPLLWSPPGEEFSTETSPMLPWQVEPSADGSSKVFGLRLGQSVLDDARALFGPDVAIAIVAPPGRPALLEAYYEDIHAGFVTGKIILTADIDDASIAQMRDRALKETYMESVTRKITLNPDDLAIARQTRIRAITFIPSAQLDEKVLIARFGQPGSRIRVSDEIEHFLYPALGLDIALNSHGREVLQYVAPRDFALLEQPLRAIAGTPTLE